MKGFGLCFMFRLSRSSDVCCCICTVKVSIKSCLWFCSVRKGLISLPIESLVNQDVLNRKVKVLRLGQNDGSQSLANGASGKKARIHGG